MNKNWILHCHSIVASSHLRSPAISVCVSVNAVSHLSIQILFSAAVRHSSINSYLFVFLSVVAIISFQIQFDEVSITHDNNWAAEFENASVAAQIDGAFVSRFPTFHFLFSFLSVAVNTIAPIPIGRDVDAAIDVATILCGNAERVSGRVLFSAFCLLGKSRQTSSVCTWLQQRPNIQN